MPATLEPLPRSTVVEQLTDALIDAVVDGTFAAGRPLPPERDLAEQLEVNRASLRQAVGRLEQIGLVVRRQGSGTVVQDPAGLTAPEVVARMGRIEERAFVADLLEVREALAGVIGRRATGAVGDGQLTQLRELCDAIETAERARDRQLLELSFFAVLVDAAGNRAISVLLRWVEQVYDNLGGVNGRFPSISGAFADGTEVADRLRTIVATIDDDGDLAAAMTDYAAATANELLGAFGRR